MNTWHRMTLTPYLDHLLYSLSPERGSCDHYPIVSMHAGANFLSNSLRSTDRKYTSVYGFWCLFACDLAGIIIVLCIYLERTFMNVHGHSTCILATILTTRIDKFVFQTYIEAHLYADHYNCNNFHA